MSAILSSNIPDRVKDMVGDLGVCPYDFEIWKTICLLDYDTLSEGATELENVLIISLEKLLLMKALAMDSEKYLHDTKLIVKRLIDLQYKKYESIVAENTRLLEGIENLTYIEQREADTP